MIFYRKKDESVIVILGLRLNRFKMKDKIKYYLIILILILILIVIFKPKPIIGVEEDNWWIFPFSIIVSILYTPIILDYYKKKPPGKE